MAQVESSAIRSHLNSVTQVWNAIYGATKEVMGARPNALFEETLTKLQPGKLLLPGEGEGRHAIYAAQLGWDVDAFDVSSAARDIALTNAKRKGVSFNYWLDDLLSSRISTDHIELSHHDGASFRRIESQKLINSSDGCFGKLRRYFEFQKR